MAATKKVMSDEARRGIEAARAEKKAMRSETSITLNYRSRRWDIERCDANNWQIVETSIVDGKESSSEPAYYPSKLYCLNIAMNKMADCTVSDTIEGILKEVKEIGRMLKEAVG